MTVLVQDDFAGSNGTDISSHTPNIDVEGGGWSDSGANEVELDGSGALKFAGSNEACWIDTGTADQVVTTSFNNGGTDNRVGVLLRSGSGNPITGTNYYFNFKPDDATNTVQILKRISGTQTFLAGANLSLSNGVTYELECSVVGTALIFKVDGVTELTVTDASITTGDFAALQHARHTNANARFYDFQVEDTGGITVATTETLSSYSDSSTVNVIPAVSITSSVTEALNSYSDAATVTITAAQNVTLSITESLQSYSDSAIADVSISLTASVTESLNSFLDSSNVTIAKDITLTITESLSAYSEFISVKVPVNWVDKTPASTTWTDQTSTSTVWIDKG